MGYIISNNINNQIDARITVAWMRFHRIQATDRQLRRCIMLQAVNTV